MNNGLIYDFNWDAYAPCGALPLCHTSRHERYQYPEVFGTSNMYDPIEGDPMLRDNKTYEIWYTKHPDGRLTWELHKQ